MTPVNLEDCKQQTARLEGYRFEPVRRVVTGHSEEGQAYIWKDEPVKPLPVTMKTGETAVFAHPWTTDAGKYDLNDERDLSLFEDNSKLSNEDGCVVRWASSPSASIYACCLAEQSAFCRVTDIPPNSISPIHRTVSLDYGIRACLFPTMVSVKY
jgi:hypothetical protein